MSDAYDDITLEGRRVRLRAPAAGELETLATAIAADAESSPWWGDDPERVLRWLTDPESETLVIEHAGRAVGIVQISEEPDPDYRSAGLDITLLEGFTDRGLGSEALSLAARHLFDERGHHRITIDPAATNARAIAAYEKVGFRPVDVMRRYERAPDGAWRDGLLMDLLPEDLADV